MNITNINIEERKVNINYKNKDIEVIFCKSEDLEFEGIEDLNEEEINEICNFVMFNEELKNIFYNIKEE